MEFDKIVSENNVSLVAITLQQVCDRLPSQSNIRGVFCIVNNSQVLSRVNLLLQDVTSVGISHSPDLDAKTILFVTIVAINC